MQINDVIKAISPCDMEQPYIFISYSARDYERVWRDVLRFQQMGYNVWLDEKNLDKKQDSWRTEALDAIRDLNCSLLVFYVSRNSLVSQHCFSELSCTVESYTKAVHFGPVKFVAVDVEPIADIVDFSAEIYAEIRRKNISKMEKTTQAITLNNCIEQFFNSNNEKVRVKPIDLPNRKIDYFEEITAAFPEDTRVMPVVELVQEKKIEVSTVQTESAAKQQVIEAPVAPVPVEEVVPTPVEEVVPVLVDEVVPAPVEEAAPVLTEEATLDEKPKAKRSRQKTSTGKKVKKPYDPVELAEIAMKVGNEKIHEKDPNYYTSFIPAEKMTPKQFNGALSKIAKGEKKEDILGMMDDTLFSNGKSGIVLSKTKLYSSWAKKNPVDLQALRQVEDIENRCRLLLIYDDHTEEVFFNNDYLIIKAMLQVYVDANNQE